MKRLIVALCCIAFLMITGCIEIDIKPGNADNTINLGSKGVTSIALLSGGENVDGSEFDATKVVIESLQAGSSTGQGIYMPVEVRKTDIKDINGDGLDDLLLMVETQSISDPALYEGPDEDGLYTLSLQGQTDDGTYFGGTDIVRIVPEKGRKK